VTAAAALAQLKARDRDHLDADLAQRGVGPGVSLVRHHHAGFQGDHVVAVVPLLALGLEGVSAGLDDAHLADAQGLGHQLGQRPVLLLHDEVLRRFPRPDGPRSGPR
jgi:hypothetical protein